MLVVDVVVVAVLIVALSTGIQRGVIASTGSIIGLVAGGVAAFWLTPLVAQWVPAGGWRGAAILGAAVGCVVVGAAVGTAIGAAAGSEVDKTPLRAIDRVLGGVASLAVTAVVLVTLAPSVIGMGMPGVSSAVASSRVLGAIDRVTPAPVDTALARLRSLVFDDGLPRLGALLGPETRPTSPPIALDDPELQRAAASVARVSGTAYACGTGMTGTGFVIAPDRVVTNAHVVAGVDFPIVELPGRDAREGRVVYFDPDDDLAVIAVDGLGAAPVPLAATLAPGTSAAVQGYPYGGPFTMSTASVLSVGSVAVPDIYDETAVEREIYALAASVQPGNSGGPVLTGDGEAVGVVFARDVNAPDRGYAVTMAELAPVADRASSFIEPVDPGRCTR